MGSAVVAEPPPLWPCSQAYKEVKKEKPPFVREPTPPPVQEPQLPDELLCMICHDLLQDAVLIPCCGNSFCDDCESLLLFCDRVLVRPSLSL